MRTNNNQVIFFFTGKQLNLGGDIIKIWFFIIGLLFIVLLLVIINFILSRIRQKHICGSVDYEVSYCNVDNLKIAYKIQGGGPPLLVIHGFMASGVIFQPVIDMLQKEFTLYLIDIIGYGMSDKQPDNNYSKKNMADTAVNLMKEMGIDKFNIMGHSMGGEVSLYICCLYPEMVQKLVLVDSAGLIKARITKGLLGRNKLLFTLFIKYIFNTYGFQNFFYRYQLYNKNKMDINLVNSIFCRNMQIPIDTMYSLFHSADILDIREKYSEIKIPVLIIWGKNDNIIPLIKGMELNRMIINSQLIVIEKCGHSPFLEYPDKFVSFAVNFLYENK